MGFQGSLDAVSFGDILNTLCNLSKEGVLTVQDDKQQKKIIYFYNNGITLIGGSQRLRIGDMLVQTAKIKAWELENALVEQKQTNKLLGEILVEQGLVTHDEIEQLISDQIEQEIFDIFFWENAQFSFEEGSQPQLFASEESQVTLTFDVQSLLLRIAEKISSWEEIRKEVPSFSILFRMVSEQTEVALPENYTQENFQQIMQYIDGTHDINDIIRLTQMPVLTVCGILANLRKQNVVRPANFEELLKVAEYYQQKGQIQRQLHFFKSALAMRPFDQNLILKIAQVYEAMGGKEAGEYFQKLGELTTEPKTACQYFERAISYLPKAISPREKLISLAKYIEDEKKELYHSKMLAKLYLEENEFQKVVSLCQSYLDRYPNDLDLHKSLVYAYSELQLTDKAIGEYEKIASILETAGNRKLAIDNFKKILQLDAARDDIARKVRQLQGVVQWETSKYLIVAGIGAVSLLFVSLIYFIFYYEIPARRIYFDAMKEWLQQMDNYDQAKIIYEKNKKNYEMLIKDYSWSTVAHKAQASLLEQKEKIKELEKREKTVTATRERYVREKLKQVNELASLGRFIEAKAYLVNYKKEYQGTNWQSLIETTEQSIFLLEQKNQREKIDTRWQKAQKHEESKEWDQALAIYKELADLPEYKKEATEQIKKISQQKVEAMLTAINESLGQALQSEKDRNWKMSLELYRKIRVFSDEINRLPLEIPTAITEKLVEINQIAQAGEQRIDKWEQKVRAVLEEAQKLENENKLEEALQKVCSIVDDEILGKTAAAQNAHLAFRLETEPPGAKIQGVEGVTPQMIWLSPNAKMELVLTFPGFLPLKVAIDRHSKPLVQTHFSKSQRWNYDTKGPVWGRVIPSRNLIVVTSRSGKVIALNQKDGRLVWDFQIPTKWGDIVEGAAIWEKTVCVGSNDQYCYALDLESGRLRWKFLSKGFIQVKPLLDEASVYFGTTDGNIYCLDRKDGKKMWEYSLPRSAIKASPVFWSPTVVFGTTDGKLIGLEIINGSVLWSQKYDGLVAHPIIAANQMFLGTASRKLDCINLENQKLIWEAELEGDLGSSIHVAGSVLYAGTNNGLFYKISRVDGQILWRTKLPKGIYASAAQVGDGVYLGGDDGCLYLLDAQTGKILWKELYGSKGIHSDLVVADNTIYLATENGVLYALEK